MKHIILVIQQIILLITYHTTDKTNHITDTTYIMLLIPKILLLMKHMIILMYISCNDITNHVTDTTYHSTD